MSDFLMRSNELTTSAQQDKTLSDDQGAVLKGAKDAISHFEQMVKEVEKHLDESVH